MFTLQQVTEGSKVSLRTMCKEAGIANYSTMSVAGMKLALSGFLQANEVTPESEAGPEYTAEEQSTFAAEVETGNELAEEIARQGASLPMATPSGNGNPPVATFVPMGFYKPGYVAPAPMAVRAPKAAKPARVQMPMQNGQRQPKPGTTCAAIWAWCERLWQAGERPEVKGVRAALGIGGTGGGTFDHTTCTVQFYAWRRFHAIRGR